MPVTSRIFKIGDHVRVREITNPFFLATGVVVRARAPYSPTPTCLVKMDRDHEELNFFEHSLELVAPGR